MLYTISGEKNTCSLDTRAAAAEIVTVPRFEAGNRGTGRTEREVGGEGLQRRRALPRVG